jgi:ABC-type multidrug transport system ATPase subunit
MQIELKNIGKKYNKDWLFQHLNYTFDIGESYAITGFNGSGKSTLLQIIAGFIIPTEGEIVNNKMVNGHWEIGNADIQFKNISLAAPYLELIEEMTATEFLHFHLQFKTYINNISIQEILDIVQLSKAANKQIRYFSSGMKQRLKLAQAFFSNTTILLLDEPCSNLDKQGISLYHQLIQDYIKNRLVIICSNDEVEYSFCNQKISLS